MRKGIRPPYPSETRIIRASIYVSQVADLCDRPPYAGRPTEILTDGSRGTRSSSVQPKVAGMHALCV